MEANTEVTTCPIFTRPPWRHCGPSSTSTRCMPTVTAEWSHPRLGLMRLERRVDTDVGARAEIATVGELTCIQSYGIFPNWVSQLTEFVLAPLLFWPMASTRPAGMLDHRTRLG